MGCLKRLFTALDERWLKPFLVHKYSAEKVNAVNRIEDELDILMDDEFDVITQHRNLKKIKEEKTPGRNTV